MLVLGRKENETILIGQDIRITIVGRTGTAVRIGIQAPRDVKILRAELAEPAEAPAGAADWSFAEICVAPGREGGAAATPLPDSCSP